MSNIHNSSIDLNLLRVFHTVFVERSVGEAAYHLGLSQSAVSHSLKKLREIFHDELFLRAGAGMEPTERARQLFEPVHELMDTFESRILPAVAFDPHKAKREFLLAMVDMAETVMLPPIMRFMKTHAPLCTLQTRRVANDAMLEALETGRIEMAIGNIPGLPGYLYRQTIFRHGYVVLVSENHPRLKGPKLSWTDYQRESHIIVASGPDQHLQDTMLTSKGIKRNVQLTVGGYLSVPWLIEGTELIATLPTRLGEGIAKAAHVKQFELPEMATPYELQSIWHPRWHNDPGHKWLRETVFELMHRYPVVQA